MAEIEGDTDLNDGAIHNARTTLDGHPDSKIMVLATTPMLC
jgi:hypothetical protein